MRARCDCPMPSRMTFPPPNFTSSPYVVKSFSTSMTRSVSARRTLSPTVGPNICAYAARLISWDMALDRFGMVRSENSCGPAALHHGGHGGHRESSFPLCPPWWRVSYADTTTAAPLRLSGSRLHLRQRTHHLLVEPEHEPRAAVGHELHLAGLARLEPHSRSRRDVEPMSDCRASIE